MHELILNDDNNYEKKSKCTPKMHLTIPKYYVKCNIYKSTTILICEQMNSPMLWQCIVLNEVHEREGLAGRMMRRRRR